MSVLLVHDEEYKNIQEGIEVSKHLSEKIRIRIVVSSIGEDEDCTVTLVREVKIKYCRYAVYVRFFFVKSFNFFVH